MCVLNDSRYVTWRFAVCTVKRHGEAKHSDASLFVTV